MVGKVGWLENPSTGLPLVRQALADGYQVTVLARTPDKMTTMHAALTVIRGDVKDAGAVEQVVAGADAVISVLGSTHNAPTFEVSQGMSNILAAMKKQGVARLIITAEAGVGDPNDAPGLFNHVMSFLLKVMAKNVLADMTRTVEMVRSSNREWTVVRLPMLTDDPPTGQVKVAYVGKGLEPRIARADIPGFLLAQVQDRTYLRQSPLISN